MANQEQLDILIHSTRYWNDWRIDNQKVLIDLSETNLSEADLSGANLSGANLAGSNLNGALLIRTDLLQAKLRGSHLCETKLTEAGLNGADLRSAKLLGADLRGADLSVADLIGADLSGADLSQADLRRAHLNGANLTDAVLWEANFATAFLNNADLSLTNLSGANFSGAILNEAIFYGAILNRTIFAFVNLSKVTGLAKCMFSGPCSIDYHTLLESENLPVEFLEGCGLSNVFIDYLPSFRESPIQYYSCFISYSTSDKEFAEKLYTDMQNEGIRCWFYPEDMKIGGKIRDAIDLAIRLKEKLIIILSENSINSRWVEKEVETAFDQETEKRTILIPIMIDDSPLSSEKAWVADIRRTRHIGDFREWNDSDKYGKAFKRLLRDLKVDKKPRMNKLL